MTVEELINELIEVYDKQKDVKINIRLNDDDESYEIKIVDVMEQQTGVYIYNW
nr:MAG TPA: hypothetical protein [Caudoviricetes sp.]